MVVDSTSGPSVSPGLRAARRIAPPLFAAAALYVVVTTVQILPLPALGPLKARVHHTAAPYLAQSWSFFAPYVPRETRIARLHLRVETPDGVRELGPFPLRQVVAHTGWPPIAGQSRAANLVTLFEFSLWNPRGPLRASFSRLLSAAARAALRDPPGRIVEVRGTIIERRIAAPGEPADAREGLALNTGWLPFDAGVEAW